MYNCTWGSGLEFWEVIEFSAVHILQKWDRQYAQLVNLPMICNFCCLELGAHYKENEKKKKIKYDLELWTLKIRVMLINGSHC